MNTRELHEFDICNAVLNLLGVPFKIVGKPDKEIREKKAVDFYGTIDEVSFYLEHTLIESYPNQIADGKQIEFLFSLEEELIGKLPVHGHFQLELATNSLKGHKDKERIINILKNWIINNSKKLKPEPPNHYLRESPPGLAFEVTLRRVPLPKNSKFSIVRGTTNEMLEPKRFERIKTAILKKCPKLKQSKKNINDVSILVLESNDIALANHALIGNALFKVFSMLDKDLIPDRIFLVMTDTNPWNIFLYNDNIFDLISENKK